MTEGQEAALYGRRVFPTLNSSGISSTPTECDLQMDQIETAIAFFRHVVHLTDREWRQRFRYKRMSSYWLKHAAERWGRENGMSAYVSNGACIAAAVYLRRQITKKGKSGPNVNIAVRTA